MKLLIVLLSAAMTTSATPLGLDFASAPEDEFGAAIVGLDTAARLGAASAGMTDLARASLELSETPMTPGDTVRHAATLAEMLDAQNEVEAGASRAASAQRHAMMLDLVDTFTASESRDVLAFAADVAAIHAVESALGVAEISFETPGAALRAIVLAADEEWTPARANDGATLDALPEPTRSGILQILDAHATARHRLEVAEALGMQVDVRGFLAARVASALPLLMTTSGENDVVDCGLYDIRPGDDDTSHTCTEASLVTLDLGGDDTYVASGGIILLPPCAVVSDTGCLLHEPSQPFVLFVDVSGDDAYSHTVMTRPGYALGSTPTVGQYTSAFSAFFELAGSDTYRIRSSHYGAFGTGAGGLFVDAAGNDHYDVNANMGAGLGAAGGIMVEGGGDDVYDLDYFGDCAGGRHRGAFFELDGGDVWTASCRHAFAPIRDSLFVDAGKDSDTYTLRSWGSSFGSCIAEACVFRDDGGDNRFSVLSYSGLRWTMGSAYGIPPSTSIDSTAVSLGLMMVGDGADTYDAHFFANPNTYPALAMGAAIFGVGVLVDEGGSNAYSATGPVSRSQGSARDGVGLFIDRGEDATISMEAGVGQGSASRGVGIIARTRGDATTVYTAGPTALSSLTSGAGIGMRVHRGDALLAGVLPDFTCDDDGFTIAGFSGTVLERRLTETYLCAPSPSAGDQLVNPLTNDEVDDVERPSIPCSSGQLKDLGCEDILTEAWGPGVVDWLDDEDLTMRTAGGLSWLSASGRLSARFEMPSVDNACKISCDSWKKIDSVG